MSDFPTATELERFVYDVKGVVLALKGRANKLKYQTAMDVLNGLEVDPKFIGDENPYVEKSELVPLDQLKEPAKSDPSIPTRANLQNEFLQSICFRIQTLSQEHKTEKYIVCSANIIMD